MNKKLHLTLVRPNYDILDKFSKPVECLALGYLASALRNHHFSVGLIDGMITKENSTVIAQKIIADGPDIVGFTVVLNYFPKSLQILMQLLRTNGFRGPIIVGGHAVSFIPERILEAVPEVDAVFSGESEFSICQFALAFARNESWQNIPGISSRGNNSILRNPPTRVFDLNKLAPPARDLVPQLVQNDGLVAISTSRGCHARCTFCSIPRFYGLHKGNHLAVGDWLATDIQRVVDEIIFLQNEFHIKELLIVDDEFFGGTKEGHTRAIELGKALEKAGSKIQFAISFRAENTNINALLNLKAGGLRHVFIGIEAGTIPDLKLYGKGHTISQNMHAVETVKSLGLSFQPGMMVFNHKSNMAQILANLKFLKEIGELKPILINSAADPHFGTPLVHALNRDSVLQDKGLKMFSNYLDPKVALAKEVAEYCANEFTQYMRLICTLQSAITFEWRREVPGRKIKEKQLIDSFEKAANQTFCNIIETTFNEIANNDITKDEVFTTVKKEITKGHEYLKLAMGLISAHLNKTEGGVRYWSQQDLIIFERGNHEKHANSH